MSHAHSHTIARFRPIPTTTNCSKHPTSDTAHVMLNEGFMTSATGIGASQRPDVY